MKKYLIMFCFAATIGCSKDDDGSNKAPVLDANVNDIVLSVQQMTTPASPQNPDNYSVWFAMAGDKVFYTNPSNTPVPQFMLAYDISGNSFTEKTPDGEVCACGYTSKIITAGNDLYYIASTNMKYSVADDEWSEMNFPETVYENNGEAGITYNDGKIYMLGGRDATKKFKYYDIGSDSWYNAPDYPTFVQSPDLVAVNNKVYALGGAVDSHKFSVYTEGEGWEELPDLPFLPRNQYDTHTVVSFQDRYIFTLGDGEVNIYDTTTGEWRLNPIEVGTVSYWYDNLFSDDENLYIVSKSNANDFVMKKISVGEFGEGE